MVYLLVFAAIFTAIIFYTKHQIKQRKERRREQIKAKWAKPNDRHLNFSLIDAYHAQVRQSTGECLSDATARDIDFENIFAYLDRTNSKVGQQYLYHHLRSGQKNMANLQGLDDLSTYFGSDQEVRLASEIELDNLGHRNAYHIHELFTTTYQSLYQHWLALYIRFAALIWILALALTVIQKNQYLFLLTLALTFFNFYLHYTNKKKIARYVHSLPQLYILMQVAKQLCGLVKLQQNNHILNSLKRLLPLKKSLSYINFQDKANNDPSDLSAGVLELIKTLLVIEPAMFLRSVNKIQQEQSSIAALFEYVAQIDLAISIQSLRAGLPYYAKPDFDNEKEMRIIDLYHPLIEDCVANSIQATTSQGTLITGSNMSGKTTFIRAVVVNALVAQTLSTSFSKSYSAPFMHLHTSIRISDNMEESQSYFQAEALSVLHILKQSTPQTDNLIIIDEIFRGTNTIERIAAAKAILSYLTANQNFVFVSTHDLELAELLGNEYAVYSFEEQVADSRLQFDYKIKKGILKHKNGIAILAALGYPISIVADANQISTSLRDKYQL